MSILISMEDVRNNIRSGNYKEPKRPENTREKNIDYIFDENKTVKENREMVKAYNDQAKINLINYRNDCYNKYKDFKNDLIAALENDYGFNPVQAKIVYDKAYDEGHAYGYEEIVNCVEDYADFASKFLDVTPGVRD